MYMLSSDWQETATKISKIIAEAWLNKKVEEQFKANPLDFLKERGISIPIGVRVEVDDTCFKGQIVQNEVTEMHLTWRIPLPPKPQNIKDEDLKSWVNGNSNTPAPGIPYTSN